MTSLRLILNSLQHFRRTHLAVALAVAVATAVLTGALLVGDSMRGSLRHLTLERLGSIDSIVLADRFFNSELAQDLAAQPGFDEHYSAALPAILVPSATAEHALESGARRAGGVTLVATDEAFWELGLDGLRPTALPDKGEVVLNEPLARELEASVGDLVVLRMPRSQAIPADSPLGRKTGLTRSLARLKVVAIVPAQGLGRFALRPNQQHPLNAYLSLPVVQDALDEPARANAILLAGHDPQRAVPATEREAIVAQLDPSLADFGLQLKRHTLGYTPAADTADAPADEQVLSEYYQLTSDRMLLEPAAARALGQAAEPWGGKPLLTWLANDIALVSDEATDDDSPQGIPYSTLAALDWNAQLGAFATVEGEPLERIEPGQIVLNRWAADTLGAAPGDTIAVRYFAPETTHGRAEEKTATFTLAAVLELAEPVEPYSRRRDATYDTPPTLANDPHFTPTVPGITDQASIDDWDPPFPFDMGRIGPEDETYWDNYRTTPKAFISLADGQRLWGSRFGEVTSIRIPITEDEPTPIAVEELRASMLAALDPHKHELGFAALPVKHNGLQASAGTTPFAGLFLGFSFFLIAAAIMLVAILFRLGLQQRAEQVGVMLAVGLSRRHTARLLAAEGALVAIAGSLLGVACGWAYAWLMLAGLRTWWVEAVVTPFLRLYATPTSLVIGLLAGWLISVLTILLSLRQMRRMSVQQFIGGSLGQQHGTSRRSWRSGAFAAILTLAGVSVALLGSRASGEAQAGAFMGGGALLLAAALLVVWRWLLAGAHARGNGGFTLLGLAARNAARNPTRSVLTIGLVAAASFLIVSISVFRLSPSLAGSGGFPLVAQSDRPIFADLNTPEGREELLGEREAALLEDATIVALRVLPGDDASCRNLYQSQRPQLLGVTPQMVEHFRQPGATQFAWAKKPPTGAFFPAGELDPADAQTPAEAKPIPVVLDNNTALYSLHLSGQLGEEFTIDYPNGQTVRFRVEGLLANSIFQGSLLIAEEDLLAHFPEVEGYQYFLLDLPPNAQASAESLLEEKLRDWGFMIESSQSLLADLLAVQNTYLSTFQSLGALGLLLGTFGLATVELRSVLERRAELALLQAAGFRRRRLALLVLTENATLLAIGLGIGTLCAMLAIVPHWGASGGFIAPLTALAAVLVAGILSGLVAVRYVLRAPLMPALRGE